MSLLGFSSGGRGDHSSLKLPSLPCQNPPNYSTDQSVGMLTLALPPLSPLPSVQSTRHDKQGASKCPHKVTHKASSKHPSTPSKVDSPDPKSGTNEVISHPNHFKGKQQLLLPSVTSEEQITHNKSIRRIITPELSSISHFHSTKGTDCLMIPLYIIC
jgi:hypothetical protein